MKTDNFTINLRDEDVFDIKMREGSAGEGTTDYEKLINKPRIEGEELIGDKSFEDLHMHVLTNLEIEALLN